MKLKIIFYIILVIVAFCFGIFVDRLFVNFPYLELDPQVGVIDVAGLTVGIFIALLIPFSVSKLIEDKRGIKAFLVEEIKDLIQIIAEIKQVLREAHVAGVFIDKDRDKIVYTIHEAELKIDSINEQIEEAFENKAKVTKKTLTDLLIRYDKYLTGGELILASFIKVDERYYKESNLEHSKIETGLKTLLQRIYKF
jgi:hypothetical protein